MSYIESHQPDWQPPFCPNPNCRFHRSLVEDWPFKKLGFFFRMAKPHRIQRYLCKACGVTFSSQTFSADYWLKRPDILPQLMLKTCGGMANRQIARDLGCCASTVNGQLRRLGRHCLLFHEQLRQGVPPPQDIVIDGLETFEYSQFFPLHHNLAIDNASGALLTFTDSPLRRKGCMTARQKARREELEATLGRPDPKAVQTGIRDLLSPLLDGVESVTIRSDDHPAYVRAMRDLNCRIRHEVTSSKERRDNRNPLWEVNLADLVLRHASKNHTRETIAWSKRRQCSSERLAVFAVWRNCVQWRREKRKRETPAMVAGWCDRKLEPTDVLRRRLFVSRIELPPRWQEYYWGQVETPALGINRRHELKRAV
jgi:transposase-like protein